MVSQIIRDNLQKCPGYTMLFGATFDDVLNNLMFRTTLTQFRTSKCNPLPLPLSLMQGMDDIDPTTLFSHVFGGGGMGGFSGGMGGFSGFGGHGPTFSFSSGSPEFTFSF